MTVLFRHLTIPTSYNSQSSTPFHHSDVSIITQCLSFQHLIYSLFYLIQCLFFCTVMSLQTTDSLFQGKPFSRESFPGNHFSMELFHKISFQKVTVPTGIFSKKALFQWDCVSARTLFRETVSQESCLGMDRVFKGIVSARTISSKELFHKIGISRN